MSSRTAGWSAWAVWGVALGFALVGLLFGILAFPAALPNGPEPMLIPIMVQGVLALLYGTISRTDRIAAPTQPDRLDLLCYGSDARAPLCCLRLRGLCPVYNRRHPAGRRAYGLGDELALHGAGVYRAVLPVPPFPRRASGVAAVAILATALGPGRLDAHPSVGNPLGLGGPFGENARLAKDVTEITAILVFLVSLTSMVVRLRRSRGRERLQVRWVAYAAVLTATSFA
jgi:hypothetical protein